MRRAYLAGGPKHGTILEKETLEDLEIPEGYRFRSALTPPIVGSNRVEYDWRSADEVVFLHNSIKDDTKASEATSAAWAELNKRARK
jgi:hypothetical protein